MYQLLIDLMHRARSLSLLVYLHHSAWLVLLPLDLFAGGMLVLRAFPLIDAAADYSHLLQRSGGALSPDAAAANVSASFDARAQIKENDWRHYAAFNVLLPNSQWMFINFAIAIKVYMIIYMLGVDAHSHQSFAFDCFYCRQFRRTR